ncbi:MAG: hypothetical protein WAM62_12800 [Pseudolabrys sp.]
MAKAKQPSKSKPKPGKTELNLNPPNWNLSADRKSVTASFLGDPAAFMKLDSTGVEELQKALGQIRGNMVPAISAALSQGEKITVIPNPVWVATPAGSVGDSLIHLRDARYGWLHYLVPKAEATKLVAFLQRQIGSP